MEGGLLPNLIARIGAALRAFRTGPATVQQFDMGWGIAGDTFKPPEYAEYQARSVGVYACTNVRARNLAGVPLRLYKGPREDRQVVTAGAAFDLLDRVNPFWTWNRLIQMTEIALGHWGEAFWILERGPNGKGTPKEIWWARADLMRVVPDPVGYLKGFIYDERGANLAFSPDEVIWFRYPNIMDQFSGLSPIAAARLSIDTGIAAMRSNKLIFDQGYQMAGVVSPADKDQRMTPEQAMMVEAMLTRRLQGGDKAHRLAVLNQSVNLQPLTLSPKDAEFLGLMRWSLADICRAYQVPPMLVMDFEKATYSNAEQAYKALWTDCLIPECQMIAAEVTEQLLPMFGGEATHAEFDLSGVRVLQEDQTETTGQMAALYQMGVPLNRLLQVFAPQLLPPGKDGYPWGDEPGGPTAAPGLADTPALPPGEDDQEEDDGTPAAAARGALKALRRLKHTPLALGSAEHRAKASAFASRIDQHQARIRKTVVRLLEDQRAALVARLRAKPPAKAIKADEDDWEEAFWDDGLWQEVFVAGIMPDVNRAARDAGNTTMRDLGVSIAFDASRPEVAAFLTGRAQRFAERVNETTWEAVRSTLNEGREAGEGIDQLAERIEETMGDRIRSSAEVISRTETMGALNGGALQAAMQSGVVDKKAWIAAIDGRERPSHNQAHVRYQREPIGIDTDFEVGDGAGPAPGDIGLPEEDIQCRCTLDFIIAEDGDDEDEERSIPSSAIAGIREWLDRHSHTT